MRVIVTSVGEPTHLLPAVPWGWALRAAGHEVLLATPPETQSVAAGSGLTMAPVGRDHRIHRSLQRLSELEQGLDGVPASPAQRFDADDPTARPWDDWLAHYRQQVGLWWQPMNDPLVGDLVDLCSRVRPDLVLWEGFSWAGAIAATACELPHVRVLSGSDLAGADRRGFLRARAARGIEQGSDPLAAWLSGRLSALGHRIDTSPAGLETLVRSHATVDFLPPSLTCADGPDVLPARFVPSNGRALLPAWLREPPRRPRVAVSLGQSSIRNTGSYGTDLRALLMGLADLDVEVVATAPAAMHHTLAPLPPSVRLESFVPLDALARTCSVVVNHGGAATLCTVARHGIPQLVVPDDTYDETMLGRRMQSCGAGLCLPPDETDASTVRESVERLLTDPAHARGARALAGEMGTMPTPSSWVPTLERLARRPLA